MINTIHKTGRRALQAGAMLFATMATMQLVWAGGYLLNYDVDTNLIAPKWNDPSQVVYYLSSAGYVGTGIDDVTLEAQVSQAISSIADAPFASLNPTYGGQVDLFDGDADGPVFGGIDGTNLVTFTDPDIIFDDVTLAYCVLSFLPYELTVDASNSDLNGDGVADLAEGVYPPGSILDADIIFDGNKTFSVLGDSPIDVQAVMLHEVGHCSGLSHTSILGATMFPTVNLDVAVGRTLSTDDSTFLGQLYPDPGLYDTNHGMIRGTVLSGADSSPVLGAHVYAVDITTGEQVVGTYSLVGGQYELPLPVGTYYIRIEPLDGDPFALDPERINFLIANTTDRRFPEEYYDVNESSLDNPEDAEPVNVSFGGIEIDNIDFVTNVAEEAALYLEFEKGLNYFSYPLTVSDGLSAFDLLNAVAGEGSLRSLQRYNPQTGRFDQAVLVNGIASGINFPLVRGEGYLAHSLVAELLGFVGTSSCVSPSLRKGLNIVGVPCAPADYSAYDFLADVGDPLLIARIRKYDSVNNTWVEAFFDGSFPAGIDFSMRDGEAFVVEMHFALDSFEINQSGQSFPPALTSLSPGQGTHGSVVTLFGQGLNFQTQATTVTFNGVGAQVLESSIGKIVVTVPAGAIDGPVKVVVNGLESNGLDFDVLESGVTEIEGQLTKLASGQTASAQIDSDGDEDVYEFVAAAGNFATIQVRAATPHAPDLEVTVKDPNGTRLVTSNTLTSSRVFIPNLEILSSGRHSITVTGVNGSGAGAYTVELTLFGTPGAPRIDVINGDYQTAVAGTTLDRPFELLAVSSTGLPASAIPMTLLIDPVPSPNSSQAAETNKDESRAGAQTFVVSSGNNGVATLMVDAPGIGGFQYVIYISAPGMEPTEILVSVLDEPIDSIEITGEDQNCGGLGCAVGTEVPQPYEVRFKDAQGEGIEGVYVDWVIVSGDGTINSGDGDFISFNESSDSNGLVDVSHTLGEQLYFAYDVTDPAAVLVKVPQQVAVGIPGQAAPVLFTTEARAGDASQVIFASASYTDITLGTVLLNAIKLFAADEFSNPVPNVPVSTTSSTGLTTYPGIWNGVEFPNNMTNERGFYVAAVGAPAGVVLPTRDEFGNSQTMGLGQQHTVQVQVPAAAASESYSVDVRMGPVITSSGQAASALIGQVVAEQLSSRAFRMQRNDTFEDADDNGQDDDAGDWSDEDETDFLNVRRVDVEDLPMMMSIKRTDDRVLSDFGLTDATIDGQEEYSGTTDATGQIVIPNVKLGAVSGGYRVTSQSVGDIRIDFYNDDFLPGQTGESIGFLPFAAQFNGLLLNARPVVIDLTLRDVFPDTGIDLGSEDPFPGVSLVSGIDLSKLNVTLNGKELIRTYTDPASSDDPPKLGNFPHYRQLELNNVGLSEVNDAVWMQRPESLRFIYLPTSDELSGTNTIDINSYEDNVGNGFENTGSDTVPKEFPYP